MVNQWYASPIGNILLAAEDEGLTGLWFEGQSHFPAPAPSASGDNPTLRQARAWLDLYFSGEIPPFSPPVLLQGTNFQKRIWAALSDIPYGQVITYGALAQSLGVRSAQAVGGAVGRNPISLILPCHRVVGANGQLTGYAGGLERKKWLLDWEQSKILRPMTARTGNPSPTRYFDP